jgi:hypothetical protein
MAKKTQRGAQFLQFLDHEILHDESVVSHHPPDTGEHAICHLDKNSLPEGFGPAIMLTDHSDLNDEVGFIGDEARLFKCLPKELRKRISTAKAPTSVARIDDDDEGEVFLFWVGMEPDRVQRLLDLHRMDLLIAEAQAVNERIRSVLTRIAASV